MRTPAIPAFAAMIFAAGIGPALAQPKSDSVEFRFAPTPGKTTRVRVITKAVGTMQMPGPLGEHRVSQEYTQELSSTCRRVLPDKSAVFDESIDRIALKLGIGGINLAFDSETFDAAEAENPLLAPVGRFFTAMAGIDYTLTADAKGRPSRVEHLTEGVRKATESLEKDPSLAALTGFLQQFVEALGDDHMLDQIQSYYRVFPPAGPLHAGQKGDDTWETRLPGLGIAVKGHSKYEIVSIEPFRGRRCAKIAVRESFRTKPKDAQAGGGAASSFPIVDVDFQSSDGQGIAYVDVDQQQLVELRQTQRMVITTYIKPPGKSDDGPFGKGIGPLTQRLNMSNRVESLDPSEPDAAHQK